MNRRRRALLLGPAAALAVGCSTSSTSGTAPPAALPGPAEWNREVQMPADDAALAARASCAFHAGALPAETLGKSHPVGARIPVDTIIVAMMENRSFDHYFQKGRAAGLDVDVAPDDFTNPDAEGKPVAPFHIQEPCFVDTAHSAASVRTQLGGGKMDGFVRSNDGIHELPAHGTADMLSGRRAMAYQTEEDVPFAYWMARNFAIGDRYFASVPSSTWPNRMFLYAAQSFGVTDNTFPEGVETTLLDRLAARQVTFRVYVGSTATFAMFVKRFLDLRAEAPERFVGMDQFYVDAAEGKLPQVAFIDPDGTSAPAHKHTDEHPPAPSTLGQAWLAKAVSALAAGPQWKRSAMFITYDEHGGLYDHVPPPPACVPDERPLDDERRALFSSYGVRVPFFVVSPYAKKKFVSHTTYDHTSIARFIEARFVIPAMSSRDANADAPWDAFDFDGVPNASPPAVPATVADGAAVARCRAVFE